jgi:osmotically-inducible protein OsmY
MREAAHLHLVVIAGKVLVKGVVGSGDERRAVLGVVRGTHGVAAVEDRLVVESRR